ncbi:MAG: hypothetical protein Q9181_007356 [Wetmoreana brouardii]
MALSISSSLIACRTAFNELIEDIQNAGKEKPEGLYIQDWEDERGRLRMWAANIGAHQTGQSSLDFRLRDSSHIQKQINKLLNELHQRLDDGRTIVADGEDSDVESIEDSSSEAEAPQTETQRLRRNIAKIINCLFEMSILVRKPAQYDIRVGSRQDDVTEYEWADQRHVKDKFPRADERLTLRLARAITRRRKYLKYRERHAAKLRQGIDDGAQGALHSGSEVLSETVATDIRNSNLDFDDKLSDLGFTQTSYASTLLSGDHFTIPAPPKASHDGAPFECPYCYFVIIVKSRSSWNRHVFHDLQPYVCTEHDCVTPDKLYTSRHEWSAHLSAAHFHEDLLRADTGKQVTRHTCPLCVYGQSTREGYDRHLARHLQELALFVLPRSDDSDEDDPEVKLSVHSSQASDQASDDAEAFLQNSETSSDGRERSPAEAVYDPCDERSQDRHKDDTHLIVPDPGLVEKTIPRVNAKKRQKTTLVEATHECKVCGRLFKRAYNWKSHMRTHDPERNYPYPCTAMIGNTPCAKKFMRKTDLDRHYDSVSSLMRTRDEGRDFSHVF